MDVKKHYESYWNKKTETEKFFSYERNWLLPKIFKKNEVVLDLGCGDGVVSEYLKKEMECDVISTDISEKALKVAKTRGLNVKKVDVEKKLPFKSSRFDTVFWGDNVEHLFDPEFTLKEVYRVLKKNGRLVLSCPNMAYYRYRLYYFLKGQLADTEWTGYPRWSWSHIRFFNRNILSEFLHKNGFNKHKYYGVNVRKSESKLIKFSCSLFAMILVVETHKKL